MIEQLTIAIETTGRSTIEITQQIRRFVGKSSIVNGICHVFLMHTSASLIISENADSDVRVDLENFISKLAPDGDPDYRHDQEGPDDMAAHIRSVLTQSEVSIPIRQSMLCLGSWQGLFLWEHRTRPHRREIIITLNGDNT